MTSRGRVLVAMSGGVDSSVAAALLKEQGYDLVGVTLHLWDADGEDKVGRCCSPEDREDARRTCDHLGVPHYVFDERRAFQKHVVDPFVAGYLAGVTPSPCVHCNQQVKLGRLLEVATELGATHVATGHYARIVNDARIVNGVGITEDAGIIDEPSTRPPRPIALDQTPTVGRTTLLRGMDRGKDQSYFLYGVPRAVLSRMVFPLGELQKGQTREEGRRLGVPNWDKGDSQELCFVPDGDVGGFVERQAALRSDASSPDTSSPAPGEAPAGRLVDEAGRALGPHGGVHRFTVGQRKGLGLPGGGPPKYVLSIVSETGEVVVGGRDRLYASEAHATDAIWTGGARPEAPFEAEVQVRYRHRAAPARVTPVEGGFSVLFHEPQRAIAPGQAAVVYRGDEVIGGGLLANRTAS